MSTVTSKLNISKVGRVCVTVADTDRALDFYVGTLGFEKVVDEPMGPDMRWVEVAVSGAETTIALAPPPQGQEAGGSQTGISSTRATSTAAHAALKEAGVDVDDEVTALRRPGAADVLAPRPGRQLAHRRPAVELITTFDLRTVDFLARLRLRTGARLVRAPRELWELLDLCGLVEVVGQPEQREQALRVEEERQLDDPAV